VYHNHSIDTSDARFQFKIPDEEEQYPSISRIILHLGFNLSEIKGHPMLIMRKHANIKLLN